jgi:hypothetical protein
MIFSLRVSRQLARGFFVFKNSWHFKDIFRGIEAYLKISILFEGSSREIQAYLKVMLGFSSNVRQFERF